MGPARKSRSVNKRFSNEVSPDNDVRNSSRNKQRKKKLSDKLGSQWTQVELERFYEAYRKYGKDWKKVAAVVRNRSIEMVEALYNMNRAYLSLPDGTASVVGLIAMMTDHYNVMEESDSEYEIYDAGMLQKPHKRKRAKVQPSNLKEDGHQSQLVASSNGCLSYLKTQPYGIQPHATGKRTPRFPVSSKKDDRESCIPPNKRVRKSEFDTNDDDVAHVAALALTEASQRGGSPKASQKLCKRTVLSKSPVESPEKMFTQPGAAQPKLSDASIYEDSIEGGGGSRRREIGAYARDINSLVDIEGVGTVEVLRKGKKFYGKKVKVEENGNNHSDDGGEACSGTEGLKGSSQKGKVDVEVSKVKTGYPQGMRKRSKKLYFGDGPFLDALEALADLSTSMLPGSTVESESSAQFQEERTMLDMDEKSGTPEATSTSHHRDNLKHQDSKEKALHAVSAADGTTFRKSKLGRYSTVNVKAAPEVKQQPQSASTTWKRKRKSLASKIPNSDSHRSKSLGGEKFPDENKYVVKRKSTTQISALSRQSKSIKISEDSSSEQKRSGNDLPVLSTEVSAVKPVSMQTKWQSRRKMHLKKMLIKKEVKFSENILENQPNKDCLSQQDGMLLLKEKLSSCMSCRLARRWCTFEWFYSAIDYPWFAKREFVDYLNHVGLGHIPRLTRVEWGVIRSSLGKPRRFSERFLQEEREKLKLYRESVRKHYTELRTGVKEGLPTDLARPLSVGKSVTAIHPKTREVHDGKVLTVDHDKCSILFDRTELGVEFVMDIDCMPLNPLDYMPEALKQNFAVDKCSMLSRESQVNGHSNFGGSMIFPSSGQLEGVSTSINTLVKQVDTNHAIAQAKASAASIVSIPHPAYSQPFIAAHNPAREADIQALSVLNRSLDEKVSSALFSLRQHSFYRDHSLPARHKHSLNSGLLGGLASPLDSSFASQESGSEILEIVKGSRLKAHTMVNAAIKAVSTMKEGEDAFTRIGEALHSAQKRQSTSDSRVPATRSQEEANSNLGHQNPLVSGTSDTSLVGSELWDGSRQNEAQIPSEVITSCVSALLMIQMCTERQYPPADVAQIIDSAVTSLQPCCPQNLPIYREIQMCMGRIKTQILALIPT